MEYAYLSDDTIFHTCASGQDSRDRRLHEELEDTKRGNQNPYIEEEHTTQWPKEKLQKENYDLQNIHIKLKIE